MATTSAAELLIKIGADPSNAEASIQRFRSTFSEHVAGVTSTFRSNLGAFNSVLESNRQTAIKWKTDLTGSMTDVLNASQQLSNTLGTGFRAFDTALGSNVASAIIWQQSIGAAFGKAALQAIGAIAQESLVRAIYSTALGFYLLAIQDYSGAAMAFESAAMFGAVGGEPRPWPARRSPDRSRARPRRHRLRGARRPPARRPPVREPAARAPPVGASRKTCR